MSGIITFESVKKDEESVVNDFQQKVGNIDIAGIIFFCSSKYNLDVLGKSLSDAFYSSKVIGCTTAGEIASHYQSGGFVAVCFTSENFNLHTHLIEDVVAFTEEDAKKIVEKTTKHLKYSETLSHKSMFGFLLVDGLSTMEEFVTAVLFEAFNGIKILGGSAGDDKGFIKTHIYFNGKFYTNAATLLLIESKLSFEIFKIQHFTPSDIEVVVTKSDPEKRIVYEVNGDTAVVEYARLIGLEVDQLSDKVFAMYPLVLQIGEEKFVRSIQKMNEDGSLVFASAIDTGLLLTIAKGRDLLDSLSLRVDKLQRDFKHIEVTLGCDCVLRKLEMEQKGGQRSIEKKLQEIKFIGFSSYGEQYNSLHINQTLVGVTIGERKS